MEDYSEKQIEYIEASCKYIVDLRDRYDEMLNDVYGEVTVAGYTYETANLLRRVDETAYDCGYNDWLDSECKNDSLVEINGEYYDKFEVDFELKRFVDDEEEEEED